MATNQALVEAIYSLLFSGGAISSGLYGGTSVLVPGGMGLRVSRAAAADPQNVWQNLFTIAGGPILVTALIGIRTIIQAGGASTMQFQHSVGPTVLDNGTAAVTGDAVGSLYFLTGAVADPIRVGAAGIPVEASKIVATAAMYGSLPLFVLSAGTIQVTMTAAAGTGSTRYVLCWIPVDSASTVVAA
jgi:hypothetical protein